MYTCVTKTTSRHTLYSTVMCPLFAHPPVVWLVATRVSLGLEWPDNKLQLNMLICINYANI